MVRFSEKIRKSGCTIKAHIPMEYEINLVELNMFASAKLALFMKPRVGRFRQIEFTGLVTENLSNRLKKTINSEELFSIVKQIVDASNDIDRGKFNQGRCLWDVEKIYISEDTGNLQFLYLPLKNYISNTDIRELISEILNLAKPISDDAQNDIFSFKLYFESIQQFGKDKIIKYLISINKGIANQYNRDDSSNSGYITDKRAEYYQHYSNRSFDEGTELFETEQDREETCLFEDYEEGTQLLSDHHDYRNCDDEETGILSDGSNDDDCLETMLLEETQDINSDSVDELIASRIHYPVLHRKSTNERISVNKPVYRIGKEKKYVDYFVANNGAVSRSHADIVTRGSQYFIIDLNSRNKTFINGKVIPVHTEIRLEDGDNIKLGNEEFVFFI